MQIIQQPGTGCRIPSRPHIATRQIATTPPLPEPRSNGAVQPRPKASHKGLKRSAILTALQTEPQAESATIAGRIGCSVRYVRLLRDKPIRGKVAERVRGLLADAWMLRLSDYELSRRLGVSRAYIGQLRANAPDLRPKIMRHDKLRLVMRRGVKKPYLMDVTNCGSASNGR